MYSVAIPTYNRAGTLAVTLESLLVQDGDLPYEIIVVDNNSSDETRAVIHSFDHRAPGRLRYVFEGTQGLFAARNAASRIARGEIIAFIDDDIIVHSNWLRAIAATYRDYPDAWCVGGKVALRLPEGFPAWFDPTSHTLTTSLSRMDLGDGIVKIEYPDAVWGANMSVKRGVLSRVGPFSPRLDRIGPQVLSGGDMEMCHRIQRAGGTVYYCGQAVVTHLVPSARMTKRYFRKRAYWDGRSEAIIFPQDPGRAIWKKVASIGSDTAAKLARAVGHYSIGDTRRAFEWELTARRRLGYLYQAVIEAAEGAPMTRAREKA